MKIKYEKPGPFTVWQVNVLCGDDPMFSWGDDEEMIYPFPWGPDTIENAWWFFFEINK